MNTHSMIPGLEMQSLLRSMAEDEHFRFEKMMFAMPRNKPSESVEKDTGRLLSLIFSGKFMVSYRQMDEKRADVIQQTGEALYLGDSCHHAKYMHPCKRLGISFQEKRISISYNDLKDHLYPSVPDIWYSSATTPLLRRELSLLYDLMDEWAIQKISETHDSFACELPRHLFRVILKHMETEPEKSPFSQSEQTFRKLRDYIDSHFGREISRKTIADVFNLSPDHTSRLFKLYTSRNLSDYILTLRMNQARDMLFSGLFSVADAASLCGYYDTAYFIKVFRKYWNELPGEIKQRARQKLWMEKNENSTSNKTNYKN